MKWKNRITGYGDEPPEKLRSNPQNWRLHPQHQRAVMTDILNEVGWVSEVIINQQTGVLLDGHLRVEEAIRNGEKSVPVTYVELSEEEERKVLSTLDPLSALVESDAGKLDSLLAQVNTNSEHIEMLLDGLRPDAAPGDKEVREKVSSRKKTSETARVMFGPYKFEISLAAYEAWLERVRQTHGSDSIAIINGMKDMLLITEIEEGGLDGIEEGSAETGRISDTIATVEE